MIVNFFLKKKVFPSKGYYEDQIIVVVQQLSCVWHFATPWTAPHQAFSYPPSPGACSNSSPLSRWRHPTISSSVNPFSSCLQSCPASGSFPTSRLITSGGQSIGASASAQNRCSLSSATFLSPLLFLPPYSSFNLCFMEKRNQEMWMSLKHVETQERMYQNIKLMS